MPGCIEFWSSSLLMMCKKKKKKKGFGEGVEGKER